MHFPYIFKIPAFSYLALDFIKFKDFIEPLHTFF